LSSLQFVASFQSLEESENIGYIIPSAIARKLIDDYDASASAAAPSGQTISPLRLRGFAEFPAFTQVGLPPHHHECAMIETTELRLL
jgi:hypothetical protein